MFRTTSILYVKNQVLKHFNIELRVSSSFAVNYLTKLYFNPTQILLKQLVDTISWHL